MVVGFSKRVAFLAVLAAAALVASPPSARAAFTLTLQEGANVVNVTDGGSNDISTGPNGIIIFAGQVGDFQIQLNVGTSNAAGNVSPAQLTILNTTINSPTGGTLTVTLTDTGFNVPKSDVGVQTQLSTTQVPTGVTVSSKSVINGTNYAPVSLSTVGGDKATAYLTINSAPFTLSNVTTFTLSGAGTVQFTGLTAVTPEPSTIAMALTALPLFGLGRWVRRRRGRNQQA